MTCYYEQAPSKDTLWTASPQPNTSSDRTKSGYHTQPHVQLDAILATLSMGPVGISDALNHTDVGLISQVGTVSALSATLCASPSACRALTALPVREPRQGKRVSESFLLLLDRDCADGMHAQAFRSASDSTLIRYVTVLQSVGCTKSASRPQRKNCNNFCPRQM